MKKLIILLLLPIYIYSQDACTIYGKIKFVEFNEDYRVKIVHFNEDVKVKFVDRFHERSGRWEIVDMFEDYKIKLVKYDPDFRLRKLIFSKGVDNNRTSRTFIQHSPTFTTTKTMWWYTMTKVKITPVYTPTYSSHPHTNRIRCVGKISKISKLGQVIYVFLRDVMLK